MTYNVVLEDKTLYKIGFTVDEDLNTFCNIYDADLDCVVTAGRAILSPEDDYDAIEGMKLSLQRALTSTPVIFDRESRSVMWEGFWGAVDSNLTEADGVSGYGYTKLILEQHVEAVQSLLQWLGK